MLNTGLGWMPDLLSLSPYLMTMSVTANKFNASNIVWPAEPLFTDYALTRAIIEFLDNNPEGVRNCHVGKAIGYNDSRQWFSYGILEKLIKQGKVEKRSINGKTLYFSVG